MKYKPIKHLTEVKVNANITIIFIPHFQEETPGNNFPDRHPSPPQPPGLDIPDCLNKLQEKAKLFPSDCLELPSIQLTKPPIPVSHKPDVVITLSPPQPPPVEVTDILNTSDQQMKVLGETNIQEVQFWKLTGRDINGCSSNLFSLSPPPAYDPADDVTDKVNIVKTVSKQFNLVTPDLISFACPTCEKKPTQTSDLKQHVKRPHDPQHRKLSAHVLGLVTGVFLVDPPQLDLEYLELNPPANIKKGGDIFDDVRHYRRFR